MEATITMLVLAGSTLTAIAVAVVLWRRIKRLRAELGRIPGLEVQCAEAIRGTSKLEIEAVSARAHLEAAERREAENRTRSEKDISELRSELSTLQGEHLAQTTQLADARARGEEQAANSEAQAKQLADAQSKLTDTFQALSARALQSNNKAFLDLAQQVLQRREEAAKTTLASEQKKTAGVVAPLVEKLGELDQAVKDLEGKRTHAYATLTAEVGGLRQTHETLRSETLKLRDALKHKSVRGRWGEIQLRRVAELAGMLEHCDFQIQASVTTDEGILRPDMIVHLPGGKTVVVDAKAPMNAYLEAIEEDDPERSNANMKRHSRHIRDHIAKLSGKAYWSQFDHAPEFVFMFLPGESYFSAALENDPGLIESGVDQRVVLATPTTLIALLKAVGYGWSQEKLAENAMQISRMASELHDSLSVLAEHIARMGGSLNSAIKNYNKVVSSAETRVMPKARKFLDCGVSTKKEIPLLEPLEVTGREIALAELQRKNNAEQTTANGEGANLLEDDA